MRYAKCFAFQVAPLLKSLHAEWLESSEMLQAMEITNLLFQLLLLWNFEDGSSRSFAIQISESSLKQYNQCHEYSKKLFFKNVTFFFKFALLLVVLLTVAAISCYTATKRGNKEFTISITKLVYQLAP